MGDISELRGLIVIVTFLGVSFLLISLMPSEIYSAEETRTVETPEFEGIDVISFVDTANTAMNETGGWTYPLDTSWYIVEIDDGDGEGKKDLGGRDLDMWYKKANETEHKIKHEHLYGVFIFTFSHFMDHYDKSGINKGKTLDVSDLEANRNPDNKTSMFRIKCNHFEATAIYNFNSTKWANFTDAWDHNELYVFHGIDFDQTSTGYNAFYLISRLLFFQMPEMNVVLNMIIAIPVWIAIGYIVVILIYRTIGAVFGGGA